MTRRIAQLAAVCIVLSCATTATAQATMGWDITGGRPWEQRVGPGLMFSVGGNDCTDDYCDDYWDTEFFGSIAGAVGFFYRVIPNFAFFGEVHTGYINTDPNWGDDDRGLLFQVTGGGEFHAPFTGWMDAYVGFGIGFAYLGGWAEYEHTNTDVQISLRGLNFEFRTGADFYLFSSMAKLGLGPQFRLGLPYWIRACWDYEHGDEDCEDADDIPGVDDDDLPFLVFFGLAGKFGF